MTDPVRARLERWRLVLGRYAKRSLPMALASDAMRAEAALDYLYGREYAERGVRGAGLSPSQLTVPRWLAEVRDLFPAETAEAIQRHALERYGMVELVTDPEILGKLTPSVELLKAILTFRGQMDARVLETARRIVKEVVDDLTERLETEVRQVMSGKLDRFRHSPLRVAENFDWRATIRANLRHWDVNEGRIVLEDVRFFRRVRRQIPWDVIIAVDQSGSMLDSVIHSSIMAGILAKLPAVRIKLFAFDTSIVDLTAFAGDPVEVLMSVQLGGGTNIGQAVAYGETLVETPQRTIFILVTDFCEGASPKVLEANVRRLGEAGVRMLGLAALDDRAAPSYDRRVTADLAGAGMEIGALTPRRLCEWISKAIS